MTPSMSVAPSKVSFLVPNISSPVLGPVTVLARHLAPDFDVEIVGPDFGYGVCPMYRDSFPYKTVACPRIYRWPDYLWESRRLEAALLGDLIIPVKAFATSIPVALAAKRHRGAKVIAYLDEWDGALMARLSPSQKARRWLKHFHHPVDDIYCPWVERLIPRCDHVLSTTTALRRKFGGEVLPIGVDMDDFSPRPPTESSDLRYQLGLQEKNLIVFGGVVRPHKGIELILAALAQIDDSRNRLVIVGPVNEHVKQLQENPVFAPYLVAIGPRPKAEMPRYLGLADLVVLPLNDDLLAQTQMPCKVFEAMSMAKPIIASAVADMPQILEGCGWTTPPDEVDALARQIQWVFSHPVESAEIGRQARKMCADKFSKSVVASRLKALVAELLS